MKKLALLFVFFLSIICLKVIIMRDSSDEIAMLHILAANAEKDDVQLVLDKKPELVNVHGLSNATALHWVCVNGSTRVKELREDVYYSNLLNFDRDADYESMIKLLHQYGADMNAKMDGDVTPLHFAAAYGSLECVKVLIESGASVAEKDSNGKIPIDWAKDNQKMAAVKYLLSITGEADNDLNEGDVAIVGCNKKYSDNRIAFSYYSDMDLVDIDEKDGGYSIASYDDKYTAIITILTQENKWIYTNLLKDNKSRNRQKRTLIEDLHFGNNHGSAQCIISYDRNDRLFSKRYSIIINDEIFVIVDSLSKDADFELDKFDEFLGSLRLMK